MVNFMKFNFTTHQWENSASGNPAGPFAQVGKGVLADTFANRPAFGVANRFYLATDQKILYRDTGSAWETFLSNFTLTAAAIRALGFFDTSNDGAGSGLDADLWDGQQFSTYLNQAVLTTSSPTFVELHSIQRVNGDFGTCVTSFDEWLRLNESQSHANGIYCATGPLRTDGQLEVGSAGSLFLADSSHVRIGKSVTEGSGGFGDKGWEIFHTGELYSGRQSGTSRNMWLDTANDGSMILFGQGGFSEGQISVSGSTVSYSGGHMSRWSQLPGLAPRKRIPRGTVMSSVDEMCAWHVDEWQEINREGYILRKRKHLVPSLSKLRGSLAPERNEQLVRSDVSSVKGDRRVYGVFERWDDDETYPGDEWDYDFFVATTGDFVIRVTGPCKGGDLVISNGDGTAIVQPDDIIRSSTVAKISKGFPLALPGQVNTVPCQLLTG